jgi:hypothetical protein
MRFAAGVQVVFLGAGVIAASRAWATDAASQEMVAVGTRPSDTVVLLLPPVDATVDAARLAPLREQVIRLEMEYQFIARQFMVVGDRLAAKVAEQSPGIDLGGKGGASERAMDGLARRTRARLVVGITASEVVSVASTGPGFQARSTIDLRIWDSQSRRWLVKGARQGFASRGGPPGWLFIGSLRDAVGSALADCLKRYPEVVKVSRSGAIVDYLKGQTAPFVWTGDGSFEGLGRLERPR